MKKIVRRLVVGYVRNATRNNLAIKQQKECINEYCHKHLLKLDKFIVDNGRSGSNLSRHGIQRLLKMIANYDVSKVICFDESRLSRNTFEYVYLRSYLEQHETDLTLLNSSKTNLSSETMKELMVVIDSLLPRVTTVKKTLSK